MRSNCAVLDFLAPPFVSRQKVELKKKKEKIEIKESFNAWYNTTKLISRATIYQLRQGDKKLVNNSAKSPIVVSPIKF
jgi:hypothetical protein